MCHHVITHMWIPSFCHCHRCRLCHSRCQRHINHAFINISNMWLHKPGGMQCTTTCQIAHVSTGQHGGSKVPWASCVSNGRCRQMQLAPAQSQSATCFEGGVQRGVHASCIYMYQPLSHPRIPVFKSSLHTRLHRCCMQHCAAQVRLMGAHHRRAPAGPMARAGSVRSSRLASLRSGGTSSVGFQLKNPHGRSMKPTVSTGTARRGGSRCRKPTGQQLRGVGGEEGRVWVVCAGQAGARLQHHVCVGSSEVLTYRKVLQAWEVRHTE